MSSNQSGEGEMRKRLIEADLVDCMVALPGQLFCSTQIPVCLWFLPRNRLTAQWREQQAEARRLDAALANNLKTLGFLANTEDIP